MSIPSAIRMQKPTQFGAVEIRSIGGYYYVYQVTSRWDSIKGRSKKVTGKSIGKITESEGYIPNANGMRLMEALNKGKEQDALVKRFGSYHVLRKISPEIENSLKQYFPDFFREIMIVALLMQIDGVSRELLPLAFEHSYFCIALSEVSLSGKRVDQLFEMLEDSEDVIFAFSKSVGIRKKKEYASALGFLQLIGRLYMLGLQRSLIESGLDKEYLIEEVLMRMDHLYQVCLQNKAVYRLSFVDDGTRKLLDGLQIDFETMV